MRFLASPFVFHRDILYPEQAYVHINALEDMFAQYLLLEYINFKVHFFRSCILIITFRGNITDYFLSRVSREANNLIFFFFAKIRVYEHERVYLLSFLLFFFFFIYRHIDFTIIS